MTKPALLQNYDTPEELCASLGICMKTLERWRLDKKAPPVTYVGRRPFYYRPSTTAWLRSQEQAAA